MNFELTNNNFDMYAIKMYNNPQCKNIEEFQEDLSRIKYIKRLFNKYKEEGILKERLILNHIITFYNVFGIEGASKMLFLKLESNYHAFLKPFLIYLNYLPEETNQYGFENVIMEQKIVNILRNI